MKKCPNCGLESDGKFCRDCGTSLTDVIGTPVPAPAPVIGSDPEPVGGVLLIDCYSATVATIGGNRYSEIVLNRLPDGSEQLDTYESDFKNTVHKAFPLEEPISEEAFAILREEGIDKWLEGEGFPAMCGGVQVIRYRDGENFYRIPNEKFPEGGGRSFNRLSAFLSSHAHKKENK